MDWWWRWSDGESVEVLDRMRRLGEEIRIRDLIVRKRRWSIHLATANFTDFERKRKMFETRRVFFCYTV